MILSDKNKFEFEIRDIGGLDVYYKRKIGDVIWLFSTKDDFEKKISQISLNISQVDNLTILNKQVISDMMSKILKYKNIEPSPQTLPPPLITSTEITEQRQKVFNNVLQTKKNGIFI